MLKKLKRAGFVELHQRSSHLYLTSADGARVVTLPMHVGKDIPVGTLHTIVFQQAGLSLEEWNQLYTSERIGGSLAVLCSYYALQLRVVGEKRPHSHMHSLSHSHS